MKCPRVRRILAPIFICLILSPTIAVATAQDSASVPQVTRKPNMIFILADDLGYGDLGCYGQRNIRTPRIDEMARQGLRFTQHYAGSTVCAPSRACLVTGRHTGHVRVRGNAESLLNPQTVTIARLLHDAGYTTGVIGKWGIGHPPPPGDPAQNGFGYFYGYLNMWHAHNYYPDFLWKNESKDPIKGNVVKVIGQGGVAIKKTQYSHDLLTAQALAFIDRNKANPFFLYLPFTIPHANNEAAGEGMEVPDDGPYRSQSWPQAQKNQAAMITRLDTSVGQILDLLKKLQLDEQTVVFFSSDNGPHSEGGADSAYFHSAGTLRGQKRDLYEGGIRVPLVVRWPEKIAANCVTDHLSAFWDFLPTAAEIAGISSPAGIDGISYYPTLIGESATQQQHDFLYWEFHEGGSQQAVRMGPWKYLKQIGGKSELFHLDTDESESHDLAPEQPEIIRTIEDYLKTARDESEVYPLRPAGTARRLESRPLR